MSKLDEDLRNLRINLLQAGVSACLIELLTQNPHGEEHISIEPEGPMWLVAMACEHACRMPSFAHDRKWKQAAASLKEQLLARHLDGPAGVIREAVNADELPMLGLEVLDQEGGKVTCYQSDSALLLKGRIYDIEDEYPPCREFRVSALEHYRRLVQSQEDIKMDARIQEYSSIL